MPTFKNNPVLNKLEFNKILERLAGECSSNIGRNRALNVYPSSDIEQIEQWQKETSEIVQMLSLGEEIPLGGITDIRDVLSKLRVHAVLEATDLLDIERILYASKNLKRFFAAKASGYDLTRMADIADRLIEIDELRDAIRLSVREDGYILDSASDQLRTIRRKRAQLIASVRSRMNAMIHQSGMDDVLQEGIVTIRGDRLVIPVKVEHKNRVPGIIHDQSASGSTLYIEPEIFVAQNNEVIQLEQDEKAEVFRILRALSDQCAQYWKELRANMRNLATIDFTVAKARLSIKMRAVAPKTLETTDIHLHRAYHPLLDEATAVPISLDLDSETRMIIITGPNTGGKTVTLKTVGLLALMHQAGLHIPVRSDSELGVFDQVFVDVGDEQSIEQSLSTFSAHLTNICDILKNLDERSLALYDEIGAGTDPGEGAALATAILNENLRWSGKTLATTHYSELKTYAYQTEYVQNASMEFSVETLRPTYRLIIGVSGESNAFAIARKIGISDTVIENAREIMRQQENDLSQKVKNLEKTRRLLNEEEDRINRERAELEDEKRIIHAQLAEAEREKANAKKQASQEAEKLLLETRKQIQTVSQELKELRKQDIAQASVSLAELRHQVDDQLSKTQIKRPRKISTGPALDPNQIKAGDSVFLASYNSNATVLSVNLSKKTAEVQAGIMKMTVPLADLSRGKNPRAVIRKKRSASSGSVKAVHSEIDLRGLTVDEALAKVDQFIDDAYLNNLRQVRIIHGKGTGALRKAIKQKLATSKYVESAYFAPANEGGDGATIAVIK
jgi:DNA mismatch repair protein MutS2